jgi:FMN phosphatase YigB (HAD superfamily)/ribulose-5-phosphate 4-epimerase/fuculose-1-phosphate aldolase
MFFDAILLDLDDTLYNYDFCHTIALNAVLDGISAKHVIAVSELAACYADLNVQLKIELGDTAASHSRFIYFKQLLAAQGLPLATTMHWHGLYWSTFYAAMSPAEGVLELLTLLKARQVKIVLLSDFLIQHQFEKLAALGILEYFDEIVTSEEVGVDKPNSKMFLAALAKIGATPEKVIIVGDSFTKDIAGAARCGIGGFWIHPKTGKPVLRKGHAAFVSILALADWLRRLDFELEHLQRLSRAIGERYDLTQAAGGNISVKLDDCMFIKASGMLLSEVNRRNGYAIVDNCRLIADLKSGQFNKLEEYALFSHARASIETYMHALLQRYTVHLHPLALNEILTRVEGRTVIEQLFPQATIIDYVTPGIDIAKVMCRLEKPSELIFLLNHGLIVSSDDSARVMSLVDEVVAVCETHLAFDYARYRNTVTLSALLNTATNLNHVCYLCEDSVITGAQEVLENLAPTFPDSVVYCAVRAMYLETLSSVEVEAHVAAHGVPKVIVYRNLVYLYDVSLNKCRDTESVLKSLVLLALNAAPKKYLPEAEIDFLSSWDAEIYRKNLRN